MTKLSDKQEKLNQWFEYTIQMCLQDEVICLIRLIRDKKVIEEKDK